MVNIAGVCNAHHTFGRTTYSVQSNFSYKKQSKYSLLNLRKRKAHRQLTYLLHPGLHGFFYRAYNAADYTHLNVSTEIKDLFQYIGRYKTHEVDLDTSLRCFVPDYIPTVGDMDAFLKVPRPDNKPDELGFKASTSKGPITTLSRFTLIAPAGAHIQGHALRGLDDAAAHAVVAEFFTLE